ncbi:hypothetical protein [Nocardiopsis kunsanensis]|uniref:hypothetical protein n=1 Tax=Nocardiopsis kunsanensis TaxID=141693 RepID=UPI000347F5EB|nr:hypothetical protein [Nocardiopsis kunsanensis]
MLGDRERAEQSVARLYGGFDVTPDIPIAQNVLRAFGKAGLLEHPAVRSSFRKIGWEV